MERLRMQVIPDILYRLRSGQSERAVAKDLGHSRITIRKYHELAKAKGYGPAKTSARVRRAGL